MVEFKMPPYPDGWVLALCSSMHGAFHATLMNMDTGQTVRSSSPETVYEAMAAAAGQIDPTYHERFAPAWAAYLDEKNTETIDALITGILAPAPQELSMRTIGAPKSNQPKVNVRDWLEARSGNQQRD